MKRLYRTCTAANARASGPARAARRTPRCMSTKPTSGPKESRPMYYAIGGAVLGAAITASISLKGESTKDPTEPRWRETKPHGRPLRAKYADKATMLKVSPLT